MQQQRRKNLEENAEHADESSLQDSQNCTTATAADTNKSDDNESGELERLVYLTSCQNNNNDSISHNEGHTSHITRVIKYLCPIFHGIRTLHLG